MLLKSFVVAIFLPNSEIGIDYLFVRENRLNQPPSPSMPSREPINSSIDGWMRGAAKLNVLDFIIPMGLKDVSPQGFQKK